MSATKIVINGVEVDMAEGGSAVGVPPGGKAGQVLTKKTDGDYDTYWEDGGEVPPKVATTINVLSPPGSLITCTGGGAAKTITSTGEDEITVPALGEYTVTRNKDNKIAERKITVSKEGETVQLVLSWRYGYRKKKEEPDPHTRIEYIYDAKNMTPAHMNFKEDKFEYGSWPDAWFITKNKPVMLKYDRTVDYELNRNDQTKRADNGQKSDVDNINYPGNAMSAIPLGWVYRYEDDTYEYEIVCEHQWDENYKAYAHTRADGTIADYFYWSMFGGSGNATKIRSIAGQTVANNLTTQNGIDGSRANGDGWYTHTWSQREYIRTLLVLMGKSTNTQAVFGNGNIRGTTMGEAALLLQTGTLKDKGQFCGFNTNNQQVKVFYIERFWSDQWDQTAGIINNKGSIYYKMTPEDSGYRVNDVDGYADSDVTLTETASSQYISGMKCGEFGCIPTTFTGSESTYECDAAWPNITQLNYILAGGSVSYAVGVGGVFTLHISYSPSSSYWNIGCGLSAEMPKEVDAA